MRAGQKQEQLGDVRAVPMKIITVTKGNSEGAVLMAAEWVEKIKYYGPFTQVQIKPNPKRAAAVDIALLGEGEKVLKAILPGERVVILCERGKELTSEGLADLLRKAGEDNTPLTFCIGGPFGHSDAVRARSTDTIRLSRMVMNHSVAHVMLLEQLYRSQTILRNEPYHH
ncbi:MAG: hypothetical protein WDW38_008805 [Sanguina aurantia]